MVNNVTLVGRTTKDCEIKMVGEGTPVCNFTLAVNRPYKNKDGENEADFIMCQAWNKQAEFLGAYIKKGNMIAITGAINTRTYQDDDDKTHYVTEINCNSVQSLETKSKDQGDQPLTKEGIEAQWKDEWNKRSVGLDSTAKTNLKKELTKKYQPKIDALSLTEDDLPF